MKLMVVEIGFEPATPTSRRRAGGGYAQLTRARGRHCGAKTWTNSPGRAGPNETPTSRTRRAQVVIHKYTQEHIAASCEFAGN